MLDPMSSPSKSLTMGMILEIETQDISKDPGQLGYWLSLVQVLIVPIVHMGGEVWDRT